MHEGVERDMNRLEQTKRVFEQFTGRCLEYAGEATIPQCQQLFNDLSATSEAAVRAVDECIQHCRKMQESGHMDEFIEAHEMAMAD